MSTDDTSKNDLDWDDYTKRFDIDLGCDHLLRFSCWKPDRNLNPQYAHLPDVEKYGATVFHKRPDGKNCLGAITFASAVSAALAPGRPSWHVESWEPLTVSPSLLCSCGDHGFIRNGKWVKA
jgi:hypothetical protein